jgi:hypothetical protein
MQPRRKTKEQEPNVEGLISPLARMQDSIAVAPSDVS